MQATIETLEALPRTEKMLPRWKRRRRDNGLRRTPDFLAFQAEVIRQSSYDDLRSIIVGNNRVGVAVRALNELERQKRIVMFLVTEKFSWADLKEDIDIYVVCMKNQRLEVVQLSVGGPSDLAERRSKHPENTAIAIMGDETLLEGLILMAAALHV